MKFLLKILVLVGIIGVAGISAFDNARSVVGEARYQQLERHDTTIKEEQ
jgi:hypothetical protein